MILPELIKEALSNARDNGYGRIIDTMTDEELVDDLMDYDCQLCDYPRASVLDSLANIRSDEYREKNRLK